jgi:hypothetical protein
MSFQNNPNLRGENNEGSVKRFVHQPLTIEHYGIHATIKENGKVTITSAPVNVNGEVEYDEVEIPASLIFKLATLLKATRSIKYVPVQGEAPIVSTITKETEVKE